MLLILVAAAAAAAKSPQSCPTLCDPIDGSPTGSQVPGILQARILEWVAISFYNAWKWKVKVKSLSRVRLLVTPWTAAYQAPLSMGFSRQEYWSGVPLSRNSSMKWMDGCGFLGLHLDITTRSAKNIKNSGEKLLLLETSHTVWDVISTLTGVEGKQLLLRSYCSISYWPCVKHSDEKRLQERGKEQMCFPLI